MVLAESRAVSNSEQIRVAVAEVLASETFARSEHLRNFLRFVCERTLAGRANEINEYSVGIEALGKSAAFAPGEDSSVRRTAYDLRQKLQKYYELEKPDAAVRIELPKGSYTPKFVEPVSKPPAPDAPRPARSRVVGGLAAALAVSLLVSAALAVLVLRGPSRADPLVREAWGALTSPGSDVLVSVGTTLHLIVRPYMTVVAGGLPKYPAPPEIYDLFRSHRPLPPGVELSMHPVDNSVQMGHAQTLAIATTTLALLGATCQILPERSVPAPTLRGRNAILIADPQNSNAAARRLENTPLTLDFDPAVQDIVVRERRGAHAVWSGKRGPDKRYTEVLGLITVLPGEGEIAGPHRTVIFSGITSVGTHGAADFFTRPDALRVLRDRLAADGYAAFPSAYQVLVRCRSDDTLLLAAEYVTHRVIAR
jgi:hypothetical protein